jgi:hypothetical protein
MRIKSALPRHPDVDAYVEGQPPELRQTTRFLVDLVRATVKGTTEAIWYGSPMFCAPAGGDFFCYVAAQSRHVNLGFRKGTELDDPDGLLEGSGKGMRHVKLHAPDTIPKAKLARLLKDAAKRAKVDL